MDPMTGRSPAARPSIEEYASSHARSVLITAYLLTGDWPTADEAAARALVAGRRAVDAAGADGGLAAIRSLVRRHVRARGEWWGRGGGLHLQELGALPTAAVDDPGRLWAGLTQLTAHERAVIVLRGHVGMTEPAIAATLGRSPADVARDLDVGSDVVAQADTGRSPAERDVEAELAAFFTAHRELTPPTGPVRRRAAEHERRRRRTLVALTTVGAVVAVVIAAVGLSALRPDEESAASGATADSIDAAGPGWPPELRQPSLPRVGPSRKLVGFQAVVVAVPASWAQRSARCAAIKRSTVVFPTGRRARLCDDSTVPRGLSAVSFNRDIAGEPEVEGEFGPRRTHGGEFIVSRPARRGGRYVAYTSAPDLGFGMSVTTRSRRTLNRIIGSITVLPAGFTTVPDCVGLTSGEVDALLRGQRLVPNQLFDHSAIGLPLEVVQQSQSVGTVVPVQTHITLGMLPR
jgi:hypothetical protein